MGACSSSSRTPEQDDALALYKATRARQDEEKAAEAERASQNSAREREVGSLPG